MKTIFYTGRKKIEFLKHTQIIDQKSKNIR